MSRVFALFVACACLAGQGLAGAFTVSPLRIELSARHPVAALDVRNEGDEPVSVQLERLAWTQPDGTDVYEETPDLIATPTVFELAPHGVQTLRIALRRAAGSTEQAYRIYARELPRPSPAAESGLQLALRIGIPVFFEGSSGKPQLVAATSPGDGGLRLRIRNVGARYVKAFSLDVSDAQGVLVYHSITPVYLLAGGEHLWPIEIGARQAAAGSLKVAVKSEFGVERIEAPPEH